MYFRPASLVLFAMFLFVSGIGCQKIKSPAPSTPTISSPDAIVRIHWQGRLKLELNANAYYFSRVWSLPETLRLQSQTFERLSAVLGNNFFGGKTSPQISNAILHPLLDDLAFEESYLEIRAATNSSTSAVLAIHVRADRAGIWETNSAIAAQMLTGISPVPNPATHGWTIQRTNDQILLARVSDWTVIAFGPAQNSLLAEITARIQCDQFPFIPMDKSLWLEASLDLRRLARIFPALNHQLSPVNYLNLTVTGDGGNVITRGNLTFSKPLPQSTPWQIPVPLMHEPLTSFTAARGLQPALADWSLWRDLGIGGPPDQLFSWSLQDNPCHVYLAAPFPDAGAKMSGLAGHLLQKINPRLATNGYIGFERASDSNGVVWGNLPDIKPFIKSATVGSNGWLFAGLLPDDRTDAPPPPEGMIQDVLQRTNLLYYDWEVTGPRLPPVLQLGQFARQIARQPQLPLDSAAVSWLGILVPRLGTSATVITRTAPDQAVFSRRSTLGLTATELLLLAGWLESPQFPAW
jgi:hypothetical protein